MGNNQLHLWSYFWRGLLSTLGVLTALVLLLSLSEVPEWIDKWKKILSDMDESNVNNVIYLVCGIIIVVTNAPWITLLFRKTRKLPLNEVEDNDASEPGADSGNGKETVSTSDDVRDEILTEDRVRSEVLQLIEKIESSDVNWRIECRNVLAGSLSNRYAEEFGRCLSDASPELAAKMYLKGLAARIDGAVLRQARLERANMDSVSTVIIQHDKSIDIVQADDYTDIFISIIPSGDIYNLRTFLKRIEPLNNDAKQSQKVCSLLQGAVMHRAYTADPIQDVYARENEPIRIQMVHAHRQKNIVPGFSIGALKNVRVGRYEITICVTGDRMDPIEKVFILSANRQGKPIFREKTS